MSADRAGTVLPKHVAASNTRPDDSPKSVGCKCGAAMCTARRTRLTESVGAGVKSDSTTT